ncbi:SDR family oxidoreductase [Herbidospora galbida]|uniref:SDR family oxidoreductase n=1 Tax=Herbidospora galbida TaxID=2575442 RepID=A0A4U3MFU5_9ACTN|nr:SDR family oxidoreductase [Herbidospora galbida]TKK88041.1 SDR family oxidoreductase [Herbidospora galbida]
MDGTILVTGGTGILGRQVIADLRRAGREVRNLARSAGGPYQGDLVTGEGVAAAADGVGTVVHLASKPPGKTDVQAARNLLKALAPGTHVVYISIVGVDRHPYSYYQVKHAVEQLVEASGLPYTILRTTQFHDFMASLCRTMTKSPIVPVPLGWAAQPIAISEVSAQLATLAMGAPAGRVADMGGPQVLSFREMVELYMAAEGKRKPIVELLVPGRVSKAFRAGYQLTPERAVGRITFQEFLRGGVPASSYFHKA